MANKDEKSDCGSTGTIEVNLTSKNKDMYLYRYIVEGGKLINLDDDTIDKYVGKTVKMRSPMYCKGDTICNKCIGDMPYKLGTYNVGLGSSKISTTLLRLGMKKFHISETSTNKIDPLDMLL